MSLFTEQVKSIAAGNWPSILQSLGVPAKALDGRNHPCPACGGTDRFQFTVRGAGAEYGRFACRGLDTQGGDGFALVMHLYGCGFNEAVKRVAAALGIHQDSHYSVRQFVPRIATVPEIDRAKINRETAKLKALFDAAEPVSVCNMAGQYLAMRGLDISLHSHKYVLHSTDSLDYWTQDQDGKPSKIGTFPALLAYIQKPDGALAGLHRIYLNENAHKLSVVDPFTGEKLDCKKLKAVHDGALVGAACRLFPIDTDGRLALAEGVENAFAVNELGGWPTWSCISAGGLRTVQLPDSVREVLIWGDNDLPDRNGRNIGKLAALAAGERFIKEGRNCRIYLPSVAGTDWLDVLNQRQQKEVA
ncbi:toprim domain-containing protein [Deefgea tanakiae]|uniref:Toprim domain-containing protein n=1 Tax=Deefgea tanakiae TaxID=2865840 RepID=A0ABX8Z3Y5_9NEIS|nr:toprim domain-containing protein [Deefgea tanakiae]QZA77292.1 toprim domain-containing protein [Deefgea tanakiae]